MDCGHIILIMFILIFGAIIIDFTVKDYEEVSVREKSEYEKSLDEDKNLVDISSVCEATFGVDEEYGAYYEVKMYDDSKTTYYLADGAYEVRENNDENIIVETAEYWIILYDGGQRVLYKKKITENDNAGAIMVVE